MTHHGAACDAASIHYGPTIKRTDLLVFRLLQKAMQLEFKVVLRAKLFYSKVTDAN